MLSFQLLDVPLSILFKKYQIFLFNVSLSPTENNCLLGYGAIYPQVPLKRQCISTRLHRITSQKNFLHCHHHENLKSYTDGSKCSYSVESMEVSHVMCVMMCVTSTYQWK